MAPATPNVPPTLHLSTRVRVEDGRAPRPSRMAVRAPAEPALGRGCRSCCRSSQRDRLEPDRGSTPHSDPCHERSDSGQISVTHACSRSAPFLIPLSPRVMK